MQQQQSRAPSWKKNKKQKANSSPAALGAAVPPARLATVDATACYAFIDFEVTVQSGDVPCEMGVCVFSLAAGVVERMHVMLAPPPGVVEALDDAAWRSAQYVAKRITGIPARGVRGARSDYDAVVVSLDALLRRHQVRALAAKAAGLEHRCIAWLVQRSRTPLAPDSLLTNAVLVEYHELMRAALSTHHLDMELANELFREASADRSMACAFHQQLNDSSLHCALQDVMAAARVVAQCGHADQLAGLVERNTQTLAHKAELARLAAEEAAAHKRRALDVLLPVQGERHMWRVHGTPLLLAREVSLRTLRAAERERATAVAWCDNDDLEQSLLETVDLAYLRLKPCAGNDPHFDAITKANLSSLEKLLAVEEIVCLMGPGLTAARFVYRAFRLKSGVPLAQIKQEIALFARVK